MLLLRYTLCCFALSGFLYMKVYQGHYFTVSIPNRWDAEYDEEEEFDVLYRTGGAGEIQISTLIHEQDLTPNDLKAIANEDLQAGARLQEVDFGDFHGFWFDYEVDGEYWCEWYLCCGQLMLFATYNCSVEDEGQENDEVDLIIGTLLPSDNTHQ